MMGETCKCGKPCAGVFAPISQDWEYGTPRSPFLLHEVCEHGTVTVDNRATGGVVEPTDPAAPIAAGPQSWKERKR